jgi:hypothetical protein
LILWDVLSWIANCQLFFNDANIVGVLWAVALTFIGYRRLKNVDYSKLGIHATRRFTWVLPFLLSVTLVVWVQDLVDIGVITPVALLFGRWVEMPAAVQPLNVVNFVVVYWNVLLTIVVFAYFYGANRFFRLLHFTWESLYWMVLIAAFFVLVLACFGVWNYNLLNGDLRTVYFWAVYPEIRVLWALFFLSVVKKGDIGD